MPSDEATGSSIPSFTDFRVGRYGAKVGLACARQGCQTKLGWTQNRPHQTQFGSITTIWADQQVLPNSHKVCYAKLNVANEMESTTH